MRKIENKLCRIYKKIKIAFSIKNIYLIRSLSFNYKNMLNIVTWENNEILRKVSENIFTNEYDKYIKIWKEMIKYIKNPENLWVWLRAPQIWINKRLIVVSLLKDWEDENFKTIMMINPVILEKSDETECEGEWCLSLPWQKWDVVRPKTIKIEFIDENKKTKNLVLSWVSARIVQHEIDHLDWVLFIDKLA